MQWLKGMHDVVLTSMPWILCHWCKDATSDWLSDSCNMVKSNDRFLGEVNLVLQLSTFPRYVLQKWCEGLYSKVFNKMQTKDIISCDIAFGGFS